MVVDEARIFGPLVLTHRFAEAREDRVLICGDQYESIARLVDVGWCDIRQDRAGAFADVSRFVVLGYQRLHHRQNRLVQGRIDNLAATGFIAIVQSGERAQARESGGQFVADADTHARGWRGRIAANIPEATHRFADGAEAGAMRIGAVLAIAGYADHDQTRIDLAQLLVATVPFLHRAGSEVLKYEIRFLDQLLQNSLAFFLTHIERDRFLVARDHGPPQRRLASLLASPHAQWIALAGRLDLNDFGAEIAE